MVGYKKMRNEGPVFQLFRGGVYIFLGLLASLLIRLK